jgi:hypothetical protein
MHAGAVPGIPLGTRRPSSDLVRRGLGGRAYPHTRDRWTWFSAIRPRYSRSRAASWTAPREIPRSMRQRWKASSVAVWPRAASRSCRPSSARGATRSRAHRGRGGAGRKLPRVEPRRLGSKRLGFRRRRVVRKEERSLAPVMRISRIPEAVAVNGYLGPGTGHVRKPTIALPGAMRFSRRTDAIGSHAGAATNTLGGDGASSAVLDEKDRRERRDRPYMIHRWKKEHQCRTTTASRPPRTPRPPS